MRDDFIERGKRKYNDIQIPEDLELSLRKMLKKSKNSSKSLITIKVLGGFTAALLVFILTVNLSPSIAYALNDIPLLKNLVQLVSYDSGFDNLINSERGQNINKTVEDKGAKFTVTSVVGDNLKLWIGYDFHGKNLIMGQVKFRSTEDNIILPWASIPSPEQKGYLEVSIDKLVKDFYIDVQVYKDDSSFHQPIGDVDEKSLEDMKAKMNQTKLTTLTIPISLNDKVYKEDLTIINDLNKEFKTAIGTFNINKLKLSESRSIVYCELISSDYELIEVENPMLVNGNGEVFSYPSDRRNIPLNNSIAIELEGGITDANSLTFKCDGIKYINKKDKYITIDVKNRMIEPNNLGVELVNIESNKIKINTKKNKVHFDLHASSEKGKPITVPSIVTNSYDGIQVLEFKKLTYEKITLKVLKVDNYSLDGFDLKLGH
jgi:hypothetical protein